MRFVLTYDGPLPPNNRKSGAKQAKHEIRKAFHPQLKKQWEVEPALQAWMAGTLTLGGLGGCEPDVPVERVVRGSFNFIPLVTKQLDLVCSLDITFQRPEQPGKIITHGGDVDNRIKTLFDSLTVPNQEQIAGMSPDPGEDPFYCLLQDDYLVVGFEVTTERLLRPTLRAEDVHLDLVVLVRPAIVTNNNIRFLGGFI